MAVNYYEILGVPRDAGDREIRQAYRKLARQYHPDVNKKDPGAEEKFKRINEAHGVLSDAEKRRKYDKYGDRWPQADEIERAEAQARSRNGFNFYSGNGPVGFDSVSFDVGGDFGNVDSDGLFDRLFKNFAAEHRGQRPAAVEYPVEVTLAEAAEGTTRTLDLSEGRRIEVKIPAGVDNGSRVHLAAGAGADGDIYLTIKVMAHPHFERKGKDLYTEVDVPVADLVLGSEVTVPTLKGKVALTIPPGTQNGRRFRIAGRGMPELNLSGAAGSLYVLAKALLPTNPGPAEQDLYRKIKDLQHN